MPNLDRFSQGLPDPQQQPIIEECCHCGREMHEGEPAFLFDDEIFCDDECIVEYALSRAAHGVIGQ
jgi:hypothetical protein